MRSMNRKLASLMNVKILSTLTVSNNVFMSVTLGGSSLHKINECE